MALIIWLFGALLASDAAIEQAIRAKFAKSKISADKFAVRVQGGIAVLEGTTEVVQRKGVATRLAKSGVAKAVDNRIRIGEAARQSAAARLQQVRKRPGAREAEKPRTAPEKLRTAAEPLASVKPPAVPLPAAPLRRAEIRR